MQASSPNSPTSLLVAVSSVAEESVAVSSVAEESDDANEETFRFADADADAVADADTVVAVDAFWNRHLVWLAGREKGSRRTEERQSHPDFHEQSDSIRHMNRIHAG